MTDTSQQQPKSDVGNLSDALEALTRSTVDAVKHPPAEPTPDPKVSAAFALGWQMAQLYRPAAAKPTPAAADDLPGPGRLTDVQRVDLSLKQIEAALAKLKPAIVAAELSVPGTDDLTKAVSAIPVDPADRSRAVQAVHADVLATLTAADFRLGKSYNLGRKLADTCRSASSFDDLVREFRPDRLAKLRSQLEDLASVFPAHAAVSVSRSLGAWVTNVNELAKPPTDSAEQTRIADERHAITVGVARQGELWRGLLSAEKAGQDMLRIGNYLDAAHNLADSTRVLAWQFVKKVPWLVALVVVLFLAGVLLMVLPQTSGSIAAGAATILASAGLTWKGLGTALGGIVAKVEAQLWGAELDMAIADAITLPPVVLLPRPPPQSQKAAGHNGDLAKAAAAGEATTRAPSPELLEPVMNPAHLQGKIATLADQRTRQATDLATLPPDHRLPADYLDSLRAQIQEEEAEQNPPRVIRAGEASAAVSAPAPPRVVYLSRKPAVSQFMTVITQCVEAELTGAPADVGHLDRLWQDVRHWTEELRSRFRLFGPCDIRWIEPKLAQVVSGMLGKHAFNDKPPEVRLGERAKVVVLGDWATGLPQSRNVAARVRSQLASADPGIDLHVVHLGDTYYSGLEDECRRRFLDLWPVDTGARAKSWTLAGNHDMYSGGHGYFNVLLGDSRFRAQSGCSYFALANDHWQILGLDSSYKNPDLPDLESPQADWLTQRVKQAAEKQRGTILMTHHQPFSAYEDVDPTLASTITEALAGHRVEAWFWGHEHRCAVYDPDIAAAHYDMQAEYAAIIGNGGVPQLLTAQVPEDVVKATRWRLEDYYQVADDRWGLGGFAVLTFDGPRAEVQYYDEYGKERRAGPPLAHEAITDVTKKSPPDNRDVLQPDVLPGPQGVAPEARSKGAEQAPTAAAPADPPLSR